MSRADALPTAAELVKQRPVISRWLRYYGVVPNDVEDITAETIAAAWHAIDRGRYEPTAGKPRRVALLNYLLGIAWRQASTSLGKAHKHREIATEPACMPRDAAVNTEPCLLARDELALLNEIKPRRRAVLLAHAAGCSMQAIAESLSIPVATGWSRLRKGRADLLAILRRETAKAR